MAGGMMWAGDEVSPFALVNDRVIERYGGVIGH